MKWRILTTKRARKQFYDLPVEVRSRIRDVLRKHADEDIPMKNAGPLVMAPGWFNLRVGTYRVIYYPATDLFEVEEDQAGALVVVLVIHRNHMNKLVKEEYKNTFSDK